MPKEDKVDDLMKKNIESIIDALYEKKEELHELLEPYTDKVLSPFYVLSEKFVEAYEKMREYKEKGGG